LGAFILEYNGVKINWLGHSGFRLTGKKVVYIDPYQIKPAVPADIILITHEHYDHCSLEDVRKIIKGNTVIVTTMAAQDKLRSLNVQFLIVVPGKSYSIDGVKVEAVPAYNVDKFRMPGRTYHPEEDNKVGFIVTMEGTRIYHAGDTDLIPGLETKVKNIDIAMLPVSGTYVMTAEEAAKAVSKINPKIAIPMHIGTIIGSKDDAYKFQRLAKCEVKILEKE
jgi:L-ascorbate metabolism protein UlaG (beta-lactamase superfamily)